MKFNPGNKDNDTLTYGEALRPAMLITDKEEAMQYKRDYIAHIQQALDANPRSDGVTAEEIANTNIAYWSGYCSLEVQARVEELFECVHPVFGSIKDNPGQ